MSCELCGSGDTHSLGMRFRHIYCHACKGHDYNGLLIEKSDWEDWVNWRVSAPKGRPSALAVSATTQEERI